jgi:hypothetical protein
LAPVELALPRPGSVLYPVCWGGGAATAGKAKYQNFYIYNLP